MEKRFADGQPPNTPTDLQCEFICESTRNANNLMTQVFISYTLDDKTFMVKLRQTLMRHHITVWMVQADYDSQTQMAFQEETKDSIEGADNFIYLISPASVQSDICEQQLEYAFSLNKRIIALQLADIDVAPLAKIAPSWQPGVQSGALLVTRSAPLSKIAQSWQLIDFRQHAEHYRDCADKLLHELHEDAQAKALKWQRQNYNYYVVTT